MTSDNLWGELPNIENISTPISILKKQAVFLGKMTNRILEGKIDTGGQSAAGIKADLDIIAPALDNYYITILTISHGIALYPVDITDHVNQKALVTVDEKDFIETLKSILGSDKVKQVIASLLINSKA